MKRAIIYARVSSKRQADDGLPVESQIDHCRSKAAALGATVILTGRSEEKLQKVAAEIAQDGGRAAEVTLANAAATLVTTEGMAALEHAVDIGIAATCAEAVGVMDKTLAITVEYMNQRKQFGVFIASFQALRHRVADMKMQLELARSMSYYASLKLGSPAEERRAAMARAKVQLGQSMRFVGQQAVQLHGGIGVTEEFLVGHYFKRAVVAQLQLGGTDRHEAACAAAPAPGP